jgi:hypothetical protein
MVRRQKRYSPSMLFFPICYLHHDDIHARQSKNFFSVSTEKMICRVSSSSSSIVIVCRAFYSSYFKICLLSFLVSLLSWTRIVLTSNKSMVVDVRKLSNGAGPARSVYQHAHFCVRTFHRVLAYPGSSLLIFFIIYLQIMDIVLYFRIRSRGPLTSHSWSSTTNQSNSLGDISSQSLESVHIFEPLPVKKIMVESIVSRV